jgi:hypothetical protein
MAAGIDVQGAGVLIAEPAISEDPIRDVEYIVHGVQPLGERHPAEHLRPEPGDGHGMAERG